MIIKIAVYALFIHTCINRLRYGRGVYSSHRLQDDDNTLNEKLMKRKLKAIGIIVVVTALIAVVYAGISHLIDEHMSEGLLGFPAATDMELTVNH